jgi:hypothetical protein
VLSSPSKCYRYEITRRGQRWEFRPSITLVYFLVGCLAAGIAFLVCLAIQTESLFRVVLFVVAFLLAGGVVWALWTSRTPLTIEPGGRVCYGAREWCAAGAVRAVRIAGARGGEWGDCEVCLELDDGKLLYLPSASFYFGSFKAREHAHSFAEELARALHVPVTESA